MIRDLKLTGAGFLLGVILAVAAALVVNSRSVSKLNTGSAATLAVRDAQLAQQLAELQVFADLQSEHVAVISSWQEKTAAEKAAPDLSAYRKKNDPAADATCSGCLDRFRRSLELSVPLEAGPAVIYRDPDVLDDVAGALDLKPIYDDCARRLKPSLACPPPARVRWIDKPKVRTALGFIAGVALVGGSVYLAGSLP